MKTIFGFLGGASMGFVVAMLLNVNFAQVYVFFMAVSGGFIAVSLFWPSVQTKSPTEVIGKRYVVSLGARLIVFTCGNPDKANSKITVDSVNMLDVSIEGARKVPAAKAVGLGVNDRRALTISEA